MVVEYLSNENWERREWSVYIDEDHGHPIATKIGRKHQDFPSISDEGLYVDDNQFCGYLSITQVKKWFTIEEIKYLLSKKVKIYRLVGEFDEVTENQVIFRKESIKKKIDITENILRIMSGVSK